MCKLKHYSPKLGFWRLFKQIYILNRGYWCKTTISHKTAICVLKICLSVFWEYYHHVDSNQNVKQATLLICKMTLCTCITPLVHFFAITTQLLWCEILYMRGWVAVRSTHKNTFFFRYRNSDLDLNNAGEPALPQFS